MMNAGPGFHSVNFARAAGHTQVAITRITGYDSKTTTGPTFGVLSALDFGQTFIPRPSGVGTSLPALGNIKRVFADSLPLFGGWARSQTGTVAGGVFYGGGSNSINACGMTFQYYGSQFAILGTIGVSNSVVVDGVGTSALANTWLGTGLSNTFHTVAIVAGGATVQIEAIDFVRPQGQVKWLNNFSVPFNSSFFEMRNSQLSIASQAITSRELQNYSVTSQKKSPVNFAIGPTIGSGIIGGTAFANVTNGVVGITSTGRPVLISFTSPQYSGATTPTSFFFVSSSPGGVQTNFSISRDGTVNFLYSMYSYGSGGLPASSFSVIDWFVPAGGHTYQLQASVAAGFTLQIIGTQMYAYEL